MQVNFSFDIMQRVWIVDEETEGIVRSITLDEDGAHYHVLSHGTIFTCDPEELLSVPS